jgi:hypothetical protein
MSKSLIIIIVALAVIICGPLITIWALNTLFPVLAIGYTFETWLATLLLQGGLGLVHKKS